MAGCAALEGCARAVVAPTVTAVMVVEEAVVAALLVLVVVLLLMAAGRRGVGERAVRGGVFFRRRQGCALPVRVRPRPCGCGGMLLNRR